MTLHGCIQRGDLDKVTRLLDDGCPVDGLNTFGQTPLCIGAESGHTEIVKVLISHGADVNVKVKDILLRGQTPLHCSAWSGHTEIVKLLIQHGADVNVKDKDEKTPLHYSAGSGHTKIVNLLIQHRADVNVKDRYGETPLYYSVWSGHTKVLKLLIQHEADIDPVNLYGDTPLMLAETRGHSDIVNILREAKPIQAGDGRLRKFFGIFSGYNSSTRKLSIQSSDGRGRITKVKYEDKEVRSHVTGAVSTSESGTGREGKVDKVKVTTKKESQGHKKQELVTKSPGLSSTSASSEQSLASASSSPTPLVQSPQTPPPSLPTSPPQPQTSRPLQPPIPSPSSPLVQSLQTPPSSSSLLTLPPQPPTPPPPESRDEITEYAQKLLKAVKSQRKSDQDSLNGLSEQLGESVIVIDHKTVNNHNTYHNHCHGCNCNNKQTTREEVLESSETLNVSVGSTKYGLLHSPQGDDYEDRGNEGEGRDNQTSDVDTKDESYTDIQANTFRESTSSRTTTTSTLSSSAAPTSTPATTSTSASELRRRLESRAGYMEKMVQSCVAGGEVCQDQSSDLVPLHHGAYVPVNLNFFMQPKNVEVNSAKQVTCGKVDVEYADWVGSNNTITNNFAVRSSSDDEDEDNTEDDNSENGKVVHIEDDSE